MAIVSLLSDFGLSDPYVGILKARVLGLASSAQLVDITHEVPPQDVRAGAFLLAQAAPWFPPGTVHLAVIDPGVGSAARRAIAVETANGFFVGPDNGLLSLAAGEVLGAVVLPIPAEAAPTFHGRDVFAPAAGKLAAGASLSALGGTEAGAIEPLDFPRPRARGASQHGEILHVDRFGNLVTNLRPADFSAGMALVGGDFSTTKLCRTYSEVARGKPLALVGSHGFIELAVRDGSAAQTLRLSRGGAVRVEPE